MVVQKKAKRDIQIELFPENVQFEYNNDVYQVSFSEPNEIRMAVYVRELEVLKNNDLFKSVTVSDCSYLELHSPNKQFLALPTRNGLEIIDLESDNSIEVNSFFMLGNQFDLKSEFCLINGQYDSQLIDLKSFRVIFRHKNLDNYISQARFGSDNKVWTIENWGQKMRIEHLDPQSLKTIYSVLETPFEFFKIDGAKYQNLIRSNKHCLWLMQSGGMRFSSYLNKWEFVKTSKGIIYRSTVPKTEVKYNTNYKVDSCEVDFEYIELIIGQEIQSEMVLEKESLWEKLKRLLN
ncbi:hypothetical protein [Croceimicrobium sp.]|uniref:hypothetical protein n=1 Tax=Croceimicrobium sp. TaxID=2828340 RepID=UPI003BACA137